MSLKLASCTLALFASLASGQYTSPSPNPKAGTAGPDIAQINSGVINTAYSPNTSNVLPSWNGMIKAYGSKYADSSCTLFPVNGPNTWGWVELAAGVNAQPAGLPANTDSIEFTFATMAQTGQTVARIQAYGLTPAFALQTSPGVYNQAAWRAIDYILATAAKYRVKVIYTVANNWINTDGPMTYVQWATGTNNTDLFFSNAQALQLYQNHLNVTANRVNSITGVVYKNDPTIFAWDLLNEPRCTCYPTQTTNLATLPASCQPSCADSITLWSGSNGHFMRMIDTQHQVLVGNEGFWGFYSPLKQYSPSNNWAALTGQNFTAQNSFQNITTAAIHYWPDTWGDNTTSFETQWLNVHQQQAASLGKPLIVEEFGKATLQPDVSDAVRTAQRLPTFTQIYTSFNQSFYGNGSLQGVMYWQWENQPQNDNINILGIAANDGLFQTVIVPNSMAALAYAKGQKVAGCSASG